jgi:hypothetical protein
MDTKSYTVRVPKRWARIALIVGVTALIVAPLTAVASHSFTDVPDSHTFHEDIEWMKESGVTRGCNPPANTRYCPEDDVKRSQMAAFMKRFAQYLGAEDGTPAQADHATTADSATSATTADDADTLDGIDSLGFVQTADRDTSAWIVVHADGSILRQSGGLTVTKTGVGAYRVDHPDLDESQIGFIGSSFNRPGAGTSPVFVTAFCNDANGCNVRLFSTVGAAVDHDFSVVLSFVDADGEVVSTSGAGSTDDFGPDNE